MAKNNNPYFSNPKAAPFAAPGQKQLQKEEEQRKSTAGNGGATLPARDVPGSAFAPRKSTPKWDGYGPPAPQKSSFDFRSAQKNDAAAQWRSGNRASWNPSPVEKAKIRTRVQLELPKGADFSKVIEVAEKYKDDPATLTVIHEILGEQLESDRSVYHKYGDDNVYFIDHEQDILDGNVPSVYAQLYDFDGFRTAYGNHKKSLVKYDYVTKLLDEESFYNASPVADNELDADYARQKAEYQQRTGKVLGESTKPRSDVEYMAHLEGKPGSFKTPMYDRSRGAQELGVELEKATDYYEKHKDNTYDDGLFGRIAANHRAGDIGVRSGEAGYTAFEHKSDNLDANDVYDLLSNRLYNNNVATYVNKNGFESWLANVASYTPQYAGQVAAQVKGGIKGALVGGVVGAAIPAGVVTGMKEGARLGASAESAWYMFRQTAGVAYVARLRETGDTEAAHILAENEAIASAVVEFGLEYATRFLGKGASKVKLPETAEKALRSAMTKLGVKEAAQNTIINTAKFVGKQTVEYFSESFEEGTQEGISIRAEHAARDGIESSPLGLLESAFYYDTYSDEEKERIREAAAAGGSLALFGGGVQSGIGAIGAIKNRNINKRAAAAEAQEYMLTPVQKEFDDLSPEAQAIVRKEFADRPQELQAFIQRKSPTGSISSDAQKIIDDATDVIYGKKKSMLNGVDVKVSATMPSDTVITADTNGVVAVDAAFTPDVANVTDVISKRTGLKFGYAEYYQNGKRNNAYNGHYDPTTKTIYFRKGASEEEIIYQTAVHELTHFAESSKHYAYVSDFVLNKKFEGVDSDAYKKAVEEKISAYAKNGIELTPEEARRELVAENIREVIFETEKDVDNLVRTDYTFAQRILDIIDGFIYHFNNTFGRLKGDAKILADLEQARRKYRLALASVKNQNSAISSGIPFQYDFDKYPYNVRTVIRDYLSSVDKDLVGFILDAQSETDKKRLEWMHRYIDGLSEKCISDINELTGVDVNGFKVKLNGEGVKHIDYRHGKNGRHDQSMRDVNDMARAKYILKNADGVVLTIDSSGKYVFDDQYKNKDNTPSKVVSIYKKINGTFYVIVAVPDSAAKTMHIKSMFITQKKESVQELDAQSPPSSTSETNLGTDSNEMVPHPDKSVKMPFSFSSPKTDTEESIFDADVPMRHIDGSVRPYAEYQAEQDAAAQATEAESAHQSEEQDFAPAPGVEKSTRAIKDNQIVADMDDAERRRLIARKRIKPPSVIASEIDDLSTMDKEALQSKYKSAAKPILKRLAEQFGVLGSKFENKDIALEFVYSKGSFHESVQKQHKEYATFAKMLSVFDDVVRNAIGIEVHKDKYAGTRRATPDLENVYVLVGAFYDGAELIPVQLEVKEFKNQENKLYLSVCLKNKMEAGRLAEDADKVGLTSAAPTASTVSIYKILQNVNPEYGDFLKYFPDDMLSKAQLRAKNNALFEEFERIEDMKQRAAIEKKLDVQEEMFEPSKESAASKETPTEVEGMRELLDDEDIPEFSEITPEMACAIDGAKKLMAHPISLALDRWAGKSKALRRVFTEVIEKPYNKAIGMLAARVAEKKAHMLELMDKHGIKKGSKESAAVQWYGEKQRMDEYGELHTYTLNDLKNEFPDSWESIVAFESEMRRIYDSYVSKINAMLIKIYPNVEARINEHERKLADKRREYDMLMREYSKDTDERLRAQLSKLSKEIKSMEEQLKNGDLWRNKRLKPRSDYFKHFVELSGVKAFLGVPVEIDPRLVGVSDNTKPNTKWASELQKRNGGQYTADAVTGMLMYIDAMEHKLAFDPIVFNLRRVAKSVAVNTAKAGMRNANGFIEHITELANSLAGKTNFIDRPIQKLIDKVPGVSSRAVTNIASKMYGFCMRNKLWYNFRTAVAQFMSLPNLTLYIQNPKHIGVGFAKTIKQTFFSKNKKDTAKSNFLAARYMPNDIMADFETKVIKRGWNGWKAGAEWFLSFGDKFTASVIWNAAYSKAKTDRSISDPIYYADDITRRCIGGRSPGEIPPVLTSKYLNVIAPFQLEPNNLFQNLKHHWLRSDMKLRKKIFGFAIFDACMFGMNLLVSLFGIEGMLPSMIEALVDVISIWTGDDEEDEKDTTEKLILSGKRLIGEAVAYVPFVNLLSTFVDNEELKTFFGEDNAPTRYGTTNVGLVGIVDALNNGDWASVLFNYSPLGAGTQIERFYEAAKDFGGFNESGESASYTPDGRLRFPMERTPGNVIKGALFGKYATKEGKEYIDTGRAPYSEERTEAFNAIVATGADPNVVYDTINEASKLPKAEQKRRFIMDAPDLTAEQKGMLDNVFFEPRENPVDYSSEDNFVITSKFSDASTQRKAFGLLDSGMSAKDAVNKVEYINSIEGDKDETGNTIKGSAKLKKLRYVHNLDIPDEQKGALYRYCMVEPDNKRMVLARANGLSDVALGRAYAYLSLVEGTKGANGKTIRGSQNRNIDRVLSQIPGLTEADKDGLRVMFMTDSKAGDYYTEKLLIKTLSGTRLTPEWKKEFAAWYYNNDKRVDTDALFRVLDGEKDVPISRITLPPTEPPEKKSIPKLF